MTRRIIAAIGITALLLVIFRPDLALWWYFVGVVILVLAIDYTLHITRQRPLVALLIALGIVATLWSLRPDPVIPGGTVGQDGYVSSSTGPGTCSHHGGVK